MLFLLVLLVQVPRSSSMTFQFRERGAFQYSSPRSWWWICRTRHAEFRDHLVTSLGQDSLMGSCRYVSRTHGRGGLMRTGHEVANHMMDDVASWYLSKVGSLSFFHSSLPRQVFQQTIRSAGWQILPIKLLGSSRSQSTKNFLLYALFWIVGINTEI